MKRRENQKSIEGKQTQRRRAQPMSGLLSLSHMREREENKAHIPRSETTTTVTNVTFAINGLNGR